MRFVSVAGRRAGFLGAIVAMLTAFAALAPSAAAQLVSGGHGRVIGMTLRAGVDRAAIRGVVAGPAASRGAVGGPAVTRAAADPGTLAYGGGQVLHSTKPYLVFWDPTASISATTRSIITSYFTDAAVDSGRATNVYSVARQFTDTTGFADYKQAFSPASQVIDDTGNYPLPDQANCKDTATRYPYCLTDAQIQTELARVISADGLPTGSGPNAPVYFVMTADNTDVCTSATSCADNVFCAYHSSLTDGSANVLYSVDPLFFDGTAQSPQNPKICQADNNAAVQAPNADVLADVGLSSISREFNDTITDPFRTGWHSSSGQEDGDQCAFYSPASDPVNDGNPDAFLPTLGGDATAGTLYDQAINGEHYYTQSEWSNQGLACRMTPTPSPLTAAFAQPPASATGTPVSFDPTASSAAAGFSSATWSWGDGTADTFQDFRSGGTPATQTHTFTAKGAYTVTLTLIDTYGNEQQVSHTVDIGLPHAAFDSSPSNPGAASPVSFDASASSDTGAPITSYSWDFGDGLSGTGKTTSHVFAKAGTYTVNLTVGDGTNTDTVSHTVTVAGVPQAAFSSLPSTPGVGAPVSFDGSSSTDSGGTLSSYSWNFGDGGTASGETASHTYAAGGAYTVTLTVGDGTSTNSISHVVSVRGAPSASFTASTATSPAAAVIQFNGSSSSEPGGSISSYAWSFGDGANGTGSTTSHAYSKAGTYTVTLIVTDGFGATASTSRQVTISGVPTAAMAAIAATQHPIAGVPFRFDGSGSSDAGSTISTYSWNFGDGGRGSGATPSHAFAKTGSFMVTLTVTDASGSSATATQTVVVKAPSITKFHVKTGKKREQLKVSVSGPGTLKLGSKKTRIAKAKTVTLTVKLSRSQRHTLRSKGKLTVRYKLSFSPISGGQSSRTVTVKVKK